MNGAQPDEAIEPKNTAVPTQTKVFDRARLASVGTRPGPASCIAGSGEEPGWRGSGSASQASSPSSRPGNPIARKAVLQPKVRDQSAERHPQKGAEARKLFEDAKALLEEIISRKSLRAAGAWGFFPAHAEGDDIVLFEDEARTNEAARFPMLRRQADDENATVGVLRSLSA